MLKPWYVHVQRLNTSLTKCQTRYCMEPRPSVDDCKVMRFLGACFAQQNALLLRTTDIRVGTEKKTPREQNSSGKKIGAERKRGADTCVLLHNIDSTQVSVVRQRKMLIKKKHCVGNGVL